MELRLSYSTLSPEIYKALYQTYALGLKASLPQAFAEWINLRVSQINGCAYCMERHAASLRDLGETSERLDTLAGWVLSPHFSDRERAAFAWTDAVTHITEGYAPDATFTALRQHFSDLEISDLTFIVCTMNALNRLAISMRR